MKTPTSEYESYFYLGVTVRARAPLPQTNCRFQQKTPKNYFKKIFFFYKIPILCVSIKKEFQVHQSHIYT